MRLLVCITNIDLDYAGIKEIVCMQMAIDSGLQEIDRVYNEVLVKAT